MLKRILQLSTCLMLAFALEPVRAIRPTCNLTEIMTSCNTHCRLKDQEDNLKASHLDVDTFCTTCVRASELSKKPLHQAQAEEAINNCKKWWKSKGYN
jgi:hypothetical protein